MSQINKLDVVDALPQYYIPYAKYVNQNRSIPDARDCLKTGTRLLLYAQHVNKLTYDKKITKAPNTIAAGMKFSVHGDASIIGTAVRLSQSFSLRYPLVYVRGTNGSQIYGSDTFAAPRYMDMQSNKITSEMTKLLSKDTIENWEWNYTQEEQYPSVFPSLFPNFVNGCTGLGVGMATSLPQYNLKQVCASAIKFLDNPNSTFEELYCPIDFCTGGTIINEADVKMSLKNGTGKAAIIRAKVEFDKANRELVVTELPYQVCSSDVLAQIQACIDNGKLVGVESVFDGSDIDGVRICIKITKTASADKILTILYKETSLQTHFTINMMMLQDGKFPRIYTFVEILETYLEHMSMVMKKAYEYDLRIAADRLEILDGYLKALLNIEEILVILKQSNDKAAATKTLIQRFEFTVNQVEAILEMKLQRLVHLEAIKLQQEHDNIQQQVQYLNFVLSDKTEFHSNMKKEINRIAKEYGDNRRTINISLNKKIETEEPIEETKVIIYLTNLYNIHVEETSTLLTSSKDRKIPIIKLNSNEVITNTIIGNLSSTILVFTNMGNMYRVNIDTLLSNKEKNISKILNLSTTENIVTISIDKTTEYIICITKKGLIKKSLLDICDTTHKDNMIIKLTTDDFLMKVLFIDRQNIGLMTANGLFKIIPTIAITTTGRLTQGVKCIKLEEDDYLIDAQLINTTDNIIISITKDGYCTSTLIDSIKVTSLLAKGKILQKGEMVNFIICSDNNLEVITITSLNIIKTTIASITSTGIRVVTLQNNETIIGVI